MIDYSYNFLANLPIWLGLIILLFFYFYFFGSSRFDVYMGSSSDRFDVHDELNEETFVQDVREEVRQDQSFTYVKRTFSIVWLVLQVIAVLLTIAGFVIQIGIWIGWLPKEL